MEPMAAGEGLADLVGHIGRVTGMDGDRAARVVDEVLAYFSEPLEAFVARRHRELRQERLRNEAIFRRIQAELPARRFAVPGLTRRQIRRIVYG